MAFATLEPFGGPVEDYRAGLAAAATVNVNRSTDTDPVDAFAFYHWHQQPKAEESEEQTSEVLASRIRSLLNAKARAAKEIDDGH